MPGRRSFIWGVSPIKLGRYPLWWIPRGRGRVRGRLFFPPRFPPRDEHHRPCWIGFVDWPDVLASDEGRGPRGELGL